jgi:ribosomal protein S18 acetylase RimI-like enzyme
MEKELFSIKRILKYIQLRIFHINVHKEHYLRLNIDINKTNELLKGFDLDVKELVYDDFLNGDPNVFKGKKLEVYKRRCQDPTYKAYGIIENGHLIYSTWVSLYRLGMSVETKPVYLAPNEGYLEDSYCDPIARGRGLHSKMNNYRIKKIFEAGKDRVIAIVQEGNTPAFKVQFKSGFEEIGTFYHGYILGIKFNTLKKEKYGKK